MLVPPYIVTISGMINPHSKMDETQEPMRRRGRANGLECRWLYLSYIAFPYSAAWYNDTQRPAQLEGDIPCDYKGKLLASLLPPKWRTWSSGSRSCACVKRG